MFPSDIARSSRIDKIDDPPVPVDNEFVIYWYGITNSLSSGIYWYGIKHPRWLFQSSTGKRNSRAGIAMSLTGVCVFAFDLARARRPCQSCFIKDRHISSRVIRWGLWFVQDSLIEILALGGGLDWD
jgi:hypothetical protein